MQFVRQIKYEKMAWELRPKTLTYWSWLVSWNNKTNHFRHFRLSTEQLPVKLALLLLLIGADSGRWNERRSTSSSDVIHRISRSAVDVCVNFSVDTGDHDVDGWRHELYSPRAAGSTHYPSSIDCVRLITGARRLIGRVMRRCWRSSGNLVVRYPVILTLWRHCCHTGHQ